MNDQFILTRTALSETLQKIDDMRDLLVQCTRVPASTSNMAVALENVRMLAARHHKEEWAQHMLRFCTDAGVTASPLREAGVPKAHEIMQCLLDNLAADMEQGVAWMNDQASVKFAENFPRLLTSIVAIRQYLQEQEP